MTKLRISSFVTHTECSFKCLDPCFQPQGIHLASSQMATANMATSNPIWPPCIMT